MNLPPQTLKTLLLKTGLLSEKDFDSVLKEAKRTEKNIVDSLISKGFITSDFYADILANYLNIPRIKLVGRKISPEILNILSEEIARTRNTVIFDKQDNSLNAAMLDPSNL